MSVTPFSIRRTAIDGLLVGTMKQVGDPRGPVREFFRLSAFEEAGVTGFGRWLQVNVTETVPGAIRGLHAEDMHKLVGVVHGAAFGAYVDLRPGDGFGTVVTVDLVPGIQVLVPPGVANAFQATGSQPAQYLYCFDDEWSPAMAGSAVNPFDPALTIPWPVAVDLSDRTKVSEKDASLPPLSALRGRT